MKRWKWRLMILVLVLAMIPAVSWARGTRYVIDWPENYVGPVYVQVFDIRCMPPYEYVDRFKVWVTWGKETKCYEIGNWGTYTLEFYKYDFCKGPMLVSGNAASFKIRYSLNPPWN